MNLLTEPWIETTSGQLSLEKLFRTASSIESLDYTSPLMKASILRFLITTVAWGVSDVTEAKSLAEVTEMPEALFQKLSSLEPHLNLFDEEKPFMQIANRREISADKTPKADEIEAIIPEIPAKDSRMWFIKKEESKPITPALAANLLIQRWFYGKAGNETKVFSTDGSANGAGVGGFGFDGASNVVNIFREGTTLFETLLLNLTATLVQGTELGWVTSDYNKNEADTLWLHTVGLTSALLEQDPHTNLSTHCWRGPSDIPKLTLKNLRLRAVTKDQHTVKYYKKHQYQKPDEKLKIKASDNVLWLANQLINQQLFWQKKGYVTKNESVTFSKHCLNAKQVETKHMWILYIQKGGSASSPTIATTGELEIPSTWSGLYENPKAASHSQEILESLLGDNSSVVKQLSYCMKFALREDDAKKYSEIPEIIKAKTELLQELETTVLTFIQTEALNLEEEKHLLKQYLDLKALIRTVTMRTYKKHTSKHLKTARAGKILEGERRLWKHLMKL